MVLSSVNSYCPSRRKTEGGAPPRRQSTTIALVSTQAVPKEAIQNAIMEQQGRCTPMEALESITFTQEGRIAAQLSCTLIMKGWKHVDDSLRRRPPQVENVGRASKRTRVEA